MGLLLFLNELTKILIGMFFPVLISSIVYVKSYKAHKQKLFRVLNKFLRV